MNSQANVPFCQSCAMPMRQAQDSGSNTDGSRNNEYCRYCYQKGKFTQPDITLEQMIEKCAGIMRQMKLSEDKIEQTKVFIPMLKRWRK